MAKRIGKLAAIVVLAAAGSYFFVYLWRWEWNRALVAGILFLAAEIGLGTVAVLDRMKLVGARPGDSSPEVLARLRQTAPRARDHFAWLAPRKSNEMGVFVPVLMGMGVLASALAWVVERLGRATAKPVLERGLAARLSPLAWPTAGLAQAESDPVALLARPGTSGSHGGARR